jgi:hypothetical protein
VVRLDCRHCDRTGGYGLAGLMRRFGPAAGLPEVLVALSADCPAGRTAASTDPAALAFPTFQVTVALCGPHQPPASGHFVALIGGSPACSVAPGGSPCSSATPIYSAGLPRRGWG